VRADVRSAEESLEDARDAFFVIACGHFVCDGEDYGMRVGDSHAQTGRAAADLGQAGEQFASARGEIRRWLGAFAGDDPCRRPVEELFERAGLDLAGRCVERQELALEAAT
jgi:hypothetical protein